MAALTQPTPLDHHFTAVVLPEFAGVAWTCVLMPNSADIFATRRAVKVTGTVNGCPLQSSLMPTGDGRHMLPVKAPILKTIGKGVGDKVTVHLTARLS